MAIFGWFKASAKSFFKYVAVSVARSYIDSTFVVVSIVIFTKNRYRKIREPRDSYIEIWYVQEISYILPALYTRLPDATLDGGLEKSIYVDVGVLGCFLNRAARH